MELKKAYEIAQKICRTFIINIPRGVHYSNSVEQTIALIIVENTKGGYDNPRNSK